MQKLAVFYKWRRLSRIWGQNVHSTKLHEPKRRDKTFLGQNALSKRPELRTTCWSHQARQSTVISGVWGLERASKTDVTPAILSRNFVAQLRSREKIASVTLWVAQLWRSCNSFSEWSSGATLSRKCCEHWAVNSFLWDKVVVVHSYILQLCSAIKLCEKIVR